MRMDKFDYAKAEACLYEAMRWKNSNGVVEIEREGKACIDLTKTHLNESYVKDILRPNFEFTNPIYAKENRGESIKKYHDSQTSSQSRAVMKGEKLSKAIGLIATLPKENPWVEKAELTDEEYEYLCKYVLEPSTDIHIHKNEEMEKTVKEKLRSVILTEEDREKVKIFLKAIMYAWIEECQIREEDVLFYSCHFDETYPHIHIMALPTVNNTYSEDVYDKRVKKDGTRTLLHAAGSESISYSVERFYAGKYVDENNRVHYPFMEKYHTNIIQRMNEFDIPSLEKTEKWTDFFTKYPDLEIQIKETATGLLNGATKGNGFLPQNYNREEREEKAAMAEAYRRMQKELEKKETELEEKEIEIAEYESKEKSLKELIQQLKKELADLVKEIALFIPNLISIYIKAWKEAKSEIAKSKVEKEAKKEVQVKAEGMYGRLKGFEEKANELLQEEEMISGVKMATFNQTPQRIGFAKKQIVKAAERMGKVDIFETHLEDKALSDWFDKEKYKEQIEKMSDVDAKLFMDSMARAERAVEVALLEIDLEAEKEIE